MGRDLPTGTVTFLFTDVEGSTKLLHALGAEAYADALATHRSILRQAFARHAGVEVDTQGDAFFVAFPTAPGALAAATQATAALADGPIRVRMGLHTGTPLLTDEGYVGPDVHKGARIAAAGHGGQILLSAATAALLNGADLRDLGEHRLKDLTAAERIFQADPDVHPPLKSLHQTNLPRMPDAFIGRGREVAAVVELLKRGTRLLTLSGPGGTGKTRLALAAAAELVAEFPDGAFWVPLAAVRDPALVLEAVAGAIGARTPPAEAIGDRHMLAVLDNLEQVVDAGPRISGLLDECPNLHVLATSREPLRVRGEREFAVPALAERDAVALFVERSGREDADVSELCRRLDNLPLAVELAAARARVLSPAQILERLGTRLDLFRGGRDADPRQATLRGAIDWSHEMLGTGERRAFAVLGVFHGGWTLEAAEAVAKADLDTLASLVDKSLVFRQEERFSMLETIRAYAEERLRELPDAETVRARHAAYYAEWADDRHDERYAAEDRWLPDVLAEADNVRAALEWAVQHDGALASRIAGAVAPLWMTAGRAGEARGWLGAALDRHGLADPARARALMHLGELSDDLAHLSDALEIWRALGDTEGEAAVLEATGWVHDVLGDYGAAGEAHARSLAVRESTGSPGVRSLGARAGLCHVLVATGRSGEARQAAAELVRVAREASATYMEQLGLHFLADADLLDDEWARAETAYRTALAFAHEHGLIGRATDEVIGVAMALGGAGHPRDAIRLAAAARAKQAEIGKGSDSWWDAMQDRLIGDARSSLSEEEVDALAAEGAAADFDVMVARLVMAEVSP